MATLLIVMESSFAASKFHDVQSRNLEAPLLYATLYSDPMTNLNSQTRKMRCYH